MVPSVVTRVVAPGQATSEDSTPPDPIDAAGIVTVKVPDPGEVSVAGKELPA